MLIDSEIAELVGAHIGDGSMGLYEGRYMISFVGDPLKDRDYIKWVLDTYTKYFQVRPKLREWSRVLGFQISSRRIFDFFVSLGIPSGRKLNIDIPDKIKSSDMNIIAACIRGIFDTDGCVYFEPKNHKHYPRIQLKITSEPLAKTVDSILNNRFSIKSTLHSRKERENWKTSYIVEARGHENLQNWLRLIGFRNNRHLSKISLWRKEYKFGNATEMIVQGPVAQHG